MLQNRMYVFRTNSLELRTDSLSAIQMAIMNFRLVDISYEKENKEKSFRLIEPVALYASNEKWIVVAWCHLRKDYRAFRLDRIQNYKILDTVFEDRKFELSKYFAECAEFKTDP